MKAKIIALIMMVFALSAVVSPSQEIDPGTGTKISSNITWHTSWSPDGKYIASVGKEHDGIYLTSLETGIQQRIYISVPYNNVSRKYSPASPCFSPDGKEVYFDTKFNDKARGTTVEYKAGGDSTVSNEIFVIMAVNVTNYGVRVVREEARCPIFSRDGRYFGYINYDHRSITDPPNAEHNLSLAVYDNITNETKYIWESPNQEISDFSFSGDNTFIAASIYDYTDNRVHINRISINGSSVEEMVTMDNPWGFTLFANPDCSPDGRWVLFDGHDGVSLASTLLIYNTQTKETKTFFPAGNIYSSDGIWSADGKKIACYLSCFGVTTALYSFDFIENNIGIAPTLTEVPLYVPHEFGTQLVDNSYSIGHNQKDPVWSPDGKWIAIMIEKLPLGPEIWIIPSGGGTPIEVADLTGSLVYEGAEIAPYCHLTGFTPDSKEIVFESAIIDESRGTEITINKGPDGNIIGTHVHNPLRVMKAVNIYTGEVRLVMDAAYRGIYSHNGRYFAYVSPWPNDGTYELMLYDNQTQQTIKLYDNVSANVNVPLFFSSDDTYMLILSGITKKWTKIHLDDGTVDDLQIDKDGVFTPDGKSLLYHGNNGLLCLYDMETQKTINITQPYEDFWAWKVPFFSPDGKKFCYTLDSDKIGDIVFVRDLNLDEAGTVTEVEIAKPLEFTLKGNYPNPFNPSTTIQFSLANAGKVNLTIYNVAGQKIRELVKNAEMTPGIHHVLWDGHDNLGKPVSSGVYLSRLQMGGKSIAGRMLLMK